MAEARLAFHGLGALGSLVAGHLAKAGRLVDLAPEHDLVATCEILFLNRLARDVVFLH